MFYKWMFSVFTQIQTPAWVWWGSQILNKHISRQDWAKVHRFLSVVRNIAGIRIVLPWQPSHFPVTPAKAVGKAVVVVAVVWGHPELGGNRRVLWRCYNSAAVSEKSGSPGLFSTEKRRLSWGKLHGVNMETLSGVLNYMPQLASAAGNLIWFIHKQNEPWCI